MIPKYWEISILQSVVHSTSIKYQIFSLYFSNNNEIQHGIFPANYRHFR